MSGLHEFISHFDAADTDRGREFVLGLQRQLQSGAYKKLTWGQWIEMLLDLIGAEQSVVRHPDGTVEVTYRRKDIAAAVQLVQAMQCGDL
jgi:hypothetical protein